MKNYNYRQIHPWRFQIDLYKGNEFLGSFVDWNANWPEVSLALTEAGYEYIKRAVILTLENNYYEYFHINL